MTDQRAMTPDEDDVAYQGIREKFEDGLRLALFEWMMKEAPDEMSVGVARDLRRCVFREAGPHLLAAYRLGRKDRDAAPPAIAKAEGEE